MFKINVFVLLMCAIALQHVSSSLMPSDILKAGQAMISNATSLLLGSGASDTVSTSTVPTVSTVSAANETILTTPAAPNINATTEVLANATTITPKD